MEEQNEQEKVQNGVEITGEFMPNPPLPAVIHRVEKGRFKKGYSANPSGMSRASAKKIERLKLNMDLAISDRWPRYLRAMDSMSDKDFAAEFRALMEFRFPKLQRVDSTSINVQAKEQQILKIGDKEYIIN